MGLILSLQGGMACGKTTAGRYAALAPLAKLISEDNVAAARRVCESGWDKRRFEPELSEPRRHMPDCIFCKQAPKSLQSRREADVNRDRGFFDFSLKNFCPPKRNGWRQCRT